MLPLGLPCLVYNGKAGSKVFNAKLYAHYWLGRAMSKCIQYLVITHHKEVLLKLCGQILCGIAGPMQGKVSKALFLIYCTVSVVVIQ